MKFRAGIALATLALSLLPAAAQADKTVWPSISVPPYTTNFGRVYDGSAFTLDANGNWKFVPLSADANGQIYCANCSSGGGGAVTVTSGHIIIDSGSTTAVTALPALPAGTAVIGHVINDASAAVIGHVIADTGSTTAVTALPALPAGANVIGHVIMDTGSTTAITSTPAAGATGSAVPANAAYQGANVGGNTTGMIACNSSIVYDASTSGATQLVALASSQSVYVCGYTLFAAGTVNVSLVYGTGANCVTGQNQVTPAYQLVAQTGLADSSPYFRGLKAIASNELCIKTSAGVAVQATVYYTQF